MKRYRIAMLTIGQELLNGSVSDTNTAYTAKRLHELGAELALAITVPDDIDAIAEAINWVKDRYDYVITSGGIGPTHDDVTMAGIAKALGQEIIRHPYLKTIMGRFCEVSDLSAAQLRLAEVPEKAELVVEDDEHIPQAYVGNIFMLPGIPEFFRQRFEKLADRFRGPELFHSSITLQGMETNLAASLNRTVRLHPDVAFGSYPSLAETDAPSSYRPVPCRIKVTFESSDQAKLAEAKEFLLKNLPDSLQLLEK